MKSLLILIAVVMVAWDGFWWLLGVPPLFPWQLRQALKKHPDTVLLDVRTAREYKWFHIPGAVSAPDLATAAHSPQLSDKDREVVVICMTGHRSPIIAYQLKKRGFKNVLNLTWGTLGYLATAKVEELLGMGAPEKPTKT